MKKLYIVLGIIVLIALNIGAFFILRSIYEHTDSRINQALMAYEEADKVRTEKLIETAIKDVQIIQGPQGQPGQSGKPGENGKDGGNGQNGQTVTGPKGDNGMPGKNGKDARQITLSTDPDTGDILWKYTDDTLWTLLIEKCQLTNTCEGAE